MTEKVAKKVVKPSAQAAVPSPANGAVDWNNLLDQFAAGTGEVLFIKKRIRVRLAPFEDPSQIFLPVKNIYRGKTSVKYVAKVLYLDAPENSSPYRALLLSKRDIRAIIQLQIEGWEIFDAETGHALSITKTGEGQQSMVTVTPSPRPRPLNEEELADLEEFDLEAAAASYSKAQEDRAASGGNGGGKPSGEEAEVEEDDYN